MPLTFTVFSFVSSAAGSFGGFEHFIVDKLITFAAFFFVLSIVVFVHEFGHFIVAKLNGIYVITFSFGFGPKLIRRRIGETEYTISALPFGGYVKFAGELGEEGAEGLEAAHEVDVPLGRLYRSKSPIQRMSVVLAGPVMNLVLAYLLYILSLYAQGIYVNPSTVVDEVERGSPAEAAGFQPRDRILAINGAPVTYWGEFDERTHLPKGAPAVFRVQRGADTLSITAALPTDSLVGVWDIGIVELVPPRIGDVKKGSPAAQAGLRSGALILSINDTTVVRFGDLSRMISPRLGKPTKFVWEYGGTVHTAVITPGKGEAPAGGERIDVVKIGQIGTSPYYEKRRISFLTAVLYGTRAFRVLCLDVVAFLEKLFTGKVTIRAIGGPLRVAVMAGEMARWGFNYLVYFLAFFSLNLAVFNLLPILPFDGGHVAVCVVELVSRRRVSRRVQQVLAQIGFIVLIILIVVIFSVDILNISG